MVKSAVLPLPRAGQRLWSAGGLAGLLTAALVMRLLNLDAYTGKFDEGIRLEQLFLMSNGFRPVRDIFAAQGPLSLDIFFGPYLLFGQTLEAARAAVVLYSLLGIVAIYWVGRVAAGPCGGLLAALLLVVSPLYLKNSRLALLEVPAMVPATVALGAALVFQQSSRQRWLFLSAVCLALALLIKPMVLPVAVPIGLALLLRSGRGVRDFLLFGATFALAGAAVLLLYGWEQVWQQVVNYRSGARDAGDWSLRGNWRIMLEELRDEQLPIYVLTVASGTYLALKRPRLGLPLASWPLASFALLLVYSPLQFKHLVILIPPMTLVVSAALSCLLSPRSEARLLRTQDSGLRTLLHPGRATAIVLGIWYLTSLPAVARQDWLVMSAATETSVDAYAEETALIGQLVGPDEFVVVDDPIVAYNSRRMVPPSLVDPSSYRVRSGSLSGTEVVEAVERYDVKLLFLFSDGLRDLDKFDDYVNQHYRAVKIDERPNAKDRALYLRQDADLESARVVLSESVDRTVAVEFGSDLKLLGYNLGRDEVRAGSSTTLTLHWEALRPMPVDYHVLTRLRPREGQPELRTQRSLGGGGEGTASWESGRWVLRSQTLAVPSRAPAGEYELYLALYDSKQQNSPAVTRGGAVGSTEVLLGRLRVR